MNTPSYNCDTLIGMEELGVGIEEIIHYARTCLPRHEISMLVRGLEQILSAGIVESDSDEAAGDETSARGAATPSVASAR